MHSWAASLNARETYLPRIGLSHIKCLVSQNRPSTFAHSSNCAGWNADSFPTPTEKCLSCPVNTHWVQTVLMEMGFFFCHHRNFILNDNKLTPADYNYWPHQNISLEIYLKPRTFVKRRSASAGFLSTSIYCPASCVRFLWRALKYWLVESIICACK